MKIWNIFLFIHLVNSLKIFTFKSSSDSNLSVVELENAGTRKLPESFKFCASHKETTIEGVSFFTLYGDDDKPWLTLSIWDFDG